MCVPRLVKGRSDVTITVRGGQSVHQELSSLEEKHAQREGAGESRDASLCYVYNVTRNSTFTSTYNLLNVQQGHTYGPGKY